MSPQTHASSVSTRSKSARRVLVVGWFSFEDMGATAGDLMAAEVVQEWLAETEIDFDVAVAKPFTGGVALAETNSSHYSHLLFVCGPFGNGPPITELLHKFSGLPLIGVDLSLLESLKTWNPFYRVFPRDVDDQAFPDISLCAPTKVVPVVGLILADRQNEYQERGRHDEVHETIRQFVAGVDASVVQIDTRLDRNRTGLKSEAEIISLISKTDVVVTTRLHGLVLSLRQGIPAVAVDAIDGGAKVTSQAKTLEWPYVISSDDCSKEALCAAFESCLSDEARALVNDCREQAVQRIDALKHELLESFD